MTVKPLGSRVVVKRKEAAVSKGGILLPETAKEKPREGQVIAVGPGKLENSGKINEMSLKVGDTVIFSPYGGVEYKMDDSELIILSEDEILAIIK